MSNNNHRGQNTLTLMNSNLLTVIDKLSVNIGK